LTGAGNEQWRGSGAFLAHDPGRALTLVLVRHGVTELTVVGRLSGGDVPGPPLTAMGQEQANRAAGVLARFEEVWPGLPSPSRLLASPTVRTRQVAAAITETLALDIEVDSRLREMEFGAWESLTPDEVEERWPGDFARWTSEGSFPPPGGESYLDVASRVGAVIDRLRESDAGRCVVVVGHASMTRAILGPALAMPATEWARITIAPGSLTVLRYYPTTTQVLTVGYPA
jgi:probable phosphoglycerate mutase